MNDIAKLEIHILIDLLLSAAKGEALDPEICQSAEKIMKDWGYKQATEADILALYDCGHNKPQSVDVEGLKRSVYINHLKNVGYSDDEITEQEKLNPDFEYGYQYGAKEAVSEAIDHLKAIGVLGRPISNKEAQAALSEVVEQASVYEYWGIDEIYEFPDHATELLGFIEDVNRHKETLRRALSYIPQPPESGCE